MLLCLPTGLFSAFLQYKKPIKKTQCLYDYIKAFRLMDSSIQYASEQNECLLAQDHLHLAQCWRVVPMQVLLAQISGRLPPMPYVVIYGCAKEYISIMQVQKLYIRN